MNNSWEVIERWLFSRGTLNLQSFLGIDLFPSNKYYSSHLVCILQVNVENHPVLSK